MADEYTEESNEGSYEKVDWINHITDSNGTVQQQGTALDALHMNHIEAGIYEAYNIVYENEDGFLCVRIPQKVNNVPAAEDTDKG